MANAYAVAERHYQPSALRERSLFNHIIRFLVNGSR
jgi:hypothetical protein